MPPQLDLTEVEPDPAAAAAADGAEGQYNQQQAAEAQQTPEQQQEQEEQQQEEQQQYQISQSFMQRGQPLSVITSEVGELNTSPDPNNALVSYASQGSLASSRPASPFQMMANTAGSDTSDSSTPGSPMIMPRGRAWGNVAAAGGSSFGGRSGTSADQSPEKPAGSSLASRWAGGNTQQGTPNSPRAAGASSSQHAELPHLKTTFDSTSRISFTSQQRVKGGAGGASALLRGSRAMRMMASSTAAAAAAGLANRSASASSPRAAAAPAAGVTGSGGGSNTSSNRDRSPSTSARSPRTSSLLSTTPPASSTFSVQRAMGDGCGAAPPSPSPAAHSADNATPTEPSFAAINGPASVRRHSAQPRMEQGTALMTAIGDTPSSAAAPGPVPRHSTGAVDLRHHANRSPVFRSRSCTVVSDGGGLVGSVQATSSSSVVRHGSMPGALPSGAYTPPTMGRLPASGPSQRRPSAPLSLSQLLTMRRCEAGGLHDHHHHHDHPSIGAAAVAQQCAAGVNVPWDNGPECWHEVQVRFGDGGDC